METGVLCAQGLTMRNGYCSLVAAVLVVMNVERTRSTQDSCRNCPAGTYCVENQLPTCRLCPPDSFSSTSGQKACDICRRCEGVFRTKKPCSPTSNAECECISGFHCLGTGCGMCEEDCRQGQELAKEGCKDCSFGTFNDQKSGICRPWTDCSLDGRSVLVNGTKDSDVVCGPTSADFSPGHTPPVIVSFLTLVSTAVLLLVVFLVLRFSAVKQGRKTFLRMLKQPFMKQVQTAQEEDSCSCRFPEEEEGDHEL